MNRKLCLLLVGGLAAGAMLAGTVDDALAKGGRKGRRNAEIVRLARPADGPDDDAGGSITIRRTRRGENATLHAKGLDARSRYQVVDGGTGDVVGTLRTNRRGRGEFSFGAPLRGKRSARADSADGKDVPEVVDIVDPETGETVLTGDTTGELQYLFGYAMLGNFTESASITMGADPSIDSQYFAFSYYAASEDGWSSGIYELYRDTAAGDELPLGAASVLDLAGKDFEVRDAAGDVAFRGTLPDVEAYSFDDPCPGHDDGQRPFDFEWSDVENAGDLEFLMGMMGMEFKGSTRLGDPTDGNDGTDGTDEEPAEFTLWIEDEDGFTKAGDLVEPEIWLPEPWEDWGDEWSDDWSNDWSWDWGWDADGTWQDPSGSGDGNATSR